MTELHFGRYRDNADYTHYLFRFPAKFHPPVVRRLLDLYSKPGDVVLDPFCGSGTLLVEARLMDRAAIGIDIDPVASFIARVKSRPIDPKSLLDKFESLQQAMFPIRRTSSAYDDLTFADFSDSSIERFRKKYRIPNIPNIHHWFRNYVTIDLARLRSLIVTRRMTPPIRDFFL